MPKYNWDLFIVLFKKELITRYQGSILGFFWTVLNPLLSIAVYYIVFGLILKLGDDNYLYYLISGVLYWNFISTSIIGFSYVYLNNAPIIKRLPVSLNLLGLANLVSNLVPYMILTFLFIIFVYPIKLFLIGVLKVMLVFSITSLFIYFFGLVIGVFNSIVKDVGYVISFVLNLLFYLTPVVYYEEAVPNSLKWLLFVNPFAPFLMLWRWATFGSDIDGIYILLSFFYILLAFIFFKLVNKKLVWIIPEVL